MRAMVSASVIVCVLVASGACRQTRPEARQRIIIDVHLHAYPIEPTSTSAVTSHVNPVTGNPGSVRSAEELMTATIAEMKRLNIVRGVVSAAEGSAEAALAWSTAAPGLFVASARCDGSVGTGFPTPCPDVQGLRDSIVRGRYAAIGEVAAQYAGLSLSDRAFEPYLALAEELDVPVGVHTGIGFPGISFNACCRQFRATLGSPALVEEALNRHPTLRVYLMHAGGPYLQETIALMRLYPEVYADLGAIDWIMPREAFHDHLKALVRAGLAKRLMFGSDQMWWPEAIAMAVDGVESATFLTEEQKRDIFCNNAARFFRWEKSDNPCL